MKRLRQVLSRMLIVILAVSQLGAAINPAHFPDYYFRIYVKQKYDKDKDNYLSYEETDVTSFILERGPVDNPNQIVEDITGIEYFTRLVLACSMC